MKSKDRDRERNSFKFVFVAHSSGDSSNVRRRGGKIGAAGARVGVGLKWVESEEKAENRKDEEKTKVRKILNIIGKGCDLWELRGLGIHNIGVSLLYLQHHDISY